MDLKLNPYSPGAGIIRPELVGRDELLTNTEISFERILAGKPKRSIMIHGLRGVGKTVLLNELEERAKKYNAITEYHEVKSSEYDQSRDEISRVVISLSRKLEKEISFIKKLVNFSKKFIQNLTSNYQINVNIPENIRINADKKELKFAMDLIDSLLELGKLAKVRNRIIILLIDKIQNLNPAVNQALIFAIHRATQKNLPVMMIGASLPTLKENSRVYVDRMFKFHYVNSLNAAKF